MFPNILPYQTIFENTLIILIELIDWNELISCDTR